MTSETHHLESPPPAVSVKARAQEIEARSQAAGKALLPKSAPPVAPKDAQQAPTSYPLPVYLSRRSSDGDTFLRCKPRQISKERRGSLERATLPPKTTVSRVLETPATVCQKETTSTLTNVLESDVDFSPAIFSHPLPTSTAPQSPLDDIITTLEKICDEFTRPGKVSPERVRTCYSSDDHYNHSNSYQCMNRDDVFEKRITRKLSDAGQVNHHTIKLLHNDGLSQDSQCHLQNASEKQLPIETSGRVSPDLPETPVIYRSSLEFTPKSAERHNINTGYKQVSSVQCNVRNSVGFSVDCLQSRIKSITKQFQISKKRLSDSKVHCNLKENCVSKSRALSNTSNESVPYSSLQYSDSIQEDVNKCGKEIFLQAQNDSKPSKPVVAYKPNLPTTLTFSKENTSLKIDESKSYRNVAKPRDRSPSEELEVVRNILVNLDFDKYKRRFSLDTERNYPAMGEKSSTTHKTQKCNSGKFKDIFEIFKPTFDYTSRLKKRPLCLRRSSSFSNAEPNTYIDENSFNHTIPQFSSKTSPLSRRNSSTTQTLKEVSSYSSIPFVASCPSIIKFESTLEARHSSPAKDHIDVLDSVGGTEASVNCLTFHSSSGIRGHYRVASDDITSSTFTPIPEILTRKTKSAEKLWTAGLNGSGKRKRRKGNSCFPNSKGDEPHLKTGKDRSLTYPQQKKGTTSEDELEFTSVDSNGLKSFKIWKSTPESAHISLMKNHLWSSGKVENETHRSGKDGLMNTSSEVHPLSTVQMCKEQNKPQKKKHHSDPGGESCSPGFSDSVISDCFSRSESGLGENEVLMITPSSSLSSSETLSKATQTFKQDSDEQTHHKLKLVIDGQVQSSVAGESFTSGANCGSRFLFPDVESSHQRLLSEISKSPQEQRRYSKRRLRGPYGEMLEEEMRKSGEKQKTVYKDLSFLQEIGDTRSKNHNASTTTDAPSVPNRPIMFLSSQSLDDATSTSELPMCVTPKRKISANYPLLTEPQQVYEDLPLNKPTEITNQKTNEKKINNDEKCSPHTKPKRDSARTSSQDRQTDTRTHVVYEILETEQSYVESLHTLVIKYMGALKSADYNGVVEGGIVDEIFFQIPEILTIHQDFLDALSLRCTNWDAKFTIGDIFIEAFTKQQVIDTYTAFINNWKCAKDATKIATQAKPAFARFLEQMSREHKGKLALDALLIMPVQRIPRYELLIKELLKHTNIDHPDYHLLVQAQKEIHDLAVKINRVERETFQLEKMQARVKEIEQHIEGMMELGVADRAFIRHDVVTIPGGLGTRKERCLFLFSDVLLITSIKKRSTAMRKPSSTPTPSTSQSPFSVLDSNKYKLLTRFSLESLEISKSNDICLKKAMRDIATLEEDIHILNQIKELIDRISSPHQTLEDVIKDMTHSVSKQMLEKQNNDYSLISLEMTVTTQERIENLTLQFSSPERRAVWSAVFNEAKQKLAISTGRRPPPELKKAMPIRKTRAGLQFTCATATLGFNQQGLREVWVCNSDGYVGQVCVLSLLPEPTVMSCNGVCNARILTIASIPATCTMISDKSRWRSTMPDNITGISIRVEEEEYSEGTANNGNIQLDSDSSDEEDEDDTESAEDEKEHRKRGNSIPREEGQEEMDSKQPTMWLGTEDGCVLVYNCNDNIRTKKNKIKIQHNAAIQCIMYLDNRVFVSIANGEVHIYKKESDGSWCTCEPQKVTIGSSSAPVTIMLAVAGKLWCGCQNSVHVLNTIGLQVEHSFPVSSDITRYILCMVTSGLGVWVTVTPSAVIRLFHATSYEPLLDVNVAPIVAKILSAATDDIIKQHKSACLRVTSMLACKDLLWIGTSAGVILTLPLPHLTSSTLTVDTIPTITGLPHGHTGHVRFLTSVEMSLGSSIDTSGCNKYSFRTVKTKESSNGRRASTTASSGSKLLVISGGDGYEDFQISGHGEQAGHDDSTNHLLLWQV